LAAASASGCADTSSTAAAASASGCLAAASVAASALPTGSALAATAAMPTATGILREAHIRQKGEPGQQNARRRNSCEPSSFHFHLRID
jgi:hypothetical protein